MRFGLLSPDEIRRMSVTKEPIQYAELFEAGKPKRFGLLDPRQGPANRSATCETCKGGFTECPGHFSYIECRYCDEVARFHSSLITHV